MEAVQAPTNQNISLTVAEHPHSDQNMAEVCWRADNIPLATFFISINIVEDFFGELLGVNVCSDDDIVRDSLFDVFVEIVDSPREMIHGEQSTRASLEPMSCGQTLEDGDGILLASIRGRDNHRGRVAMEEHGGGGQAVAGGGQVARVARGEGVVGGEVSSN